MNSLPIRFFHAFLSGAIIALLVALAILQVKPQLHATPDGGEPETSGSGGSTGSSSPPPAVAPLAPTPDDLDGDWIPNAWETANSHNPNDATDAGRDFDNDGLTTFQEYQLSQSSNGARGNPLGKWKAFEYTLPQQTKATNTSGQWR